MKILESLFGKLLLTGLACCCFSWVKADTKPFFTTGIDISHILSAKRPQVFCYMKERPM